MHVAREDPVARPLLLSVADVATERFADLVRLLEVAVTDYEEWTLPLESARSWEVFWKSAASGAHRLLALALGAALVDSISMISAGVPDIAFDPQCIVAAFADLKPGIVELDLVIDALTDCGDDAFTPARSQVIRRCREDASLDHICDTLGLAAALLDHEARARTLQLAPVIAQQRAAIERVCGIAPVGDVLVSAGGTLWNRGGFLFGETPEMSRESHLGLAFTESSLAIVSDERAPDQRRATITHELIHLLQCEPPTDIAWKNRLTTHLLCEGFTEALTRRICPPSDDQPTYSLLAALAENIALIAGNDDLVPHLATTGSETILRECAVMLTGDASAAGEARLAGALNETLRDHAHCADPFEQGTIVAAILDRNW